MLWRNCSGESATFWGDEGDLDEAKDPDNSTYSARLEPEPEL